MAALEILGEAPNGEHRYRVTVDDHDAYVTPEELIRILGASMRPEDIRELSRRTVEPLLGNPPESQAQGGIRRES